MAMYVIATIPLIQRIANENVKQTWYADAAAAGGDLVSIKKWWDDLQKLGPDYGNFPNLKTIFFSTASDLFRDKGSTVCSEWHSLPGSSYRDIQFRQVICSGECWCLGR